MTDNIGNIPPERNSSASDPSPYAHIHEEAPAVVVKPDNKRRRAVSFLTVLALLVALCTLIGWLMSWSYWQTQQKQLQTTLSQMQTGIEQFGTQTAQLRQYIDEQQRHLQQQQATMGAMENEFHHFIGHASNDLERYSLSEASYLVEQANLTLNYTHDVQGALVLFMAANDRVQSLNDPRLAALKQVMTRDLAQLQAVPTTHLANIITQLQVAAEYVDRMPLYRPVTDFASTQNSQEANQAAASAQSGVQGWRKALRASWQSIQQWLVIRHRDQPVLPLLAPQQEAILRENIKILLQQAQWAAVHGQTVIYHLSLQQVITAITTYFAQNAPATNTLRFYIAALQQIDLNPALPNLSQSLSLLQQIVRQQGGETLQSSAHIDNPTALQPNKDLGSITPGDEDLSLSLGTPSTHVVPAPQQNAQQQESTQQQQSASPNAQTLQPKSAQNDVGVPELNSDFPRDTDSEPKRVQQPL